MYVFERKLYLKMPVLDDFYTLDGFCKVDSSFNSADFFQTVTSNPKAVWSTFRGFSVLLFIVGDGERRNTP